jgi:predicted Ser/Thr protein kinase
MPTRFQEIRATFVAWLRLPEDERAARLAQLRVSDPGMAAELARLFAADAKPASVDRVAELVADAVVPERFGRFRVIREIGRGGMGVVYEAEQDLPRRRVALKTTLASGTGHDALFRREVQAMVEVLHPGIPQVYEVFEADGRTIAAMELVEGQPLLEAVATRFPTREARVRLLLRVVEAIAAAHARGVVHRDVKPSNVLVTPDGRPKVIDFGIATFGDLHGPAGSGTLAYVAPEQLAGDAVGARADVYALGGLAWRALLGREPVALDGLDRAEALARKLVLVRPPPELPIDLGAVLARALAPDPADRYADAGELADDLRRHLDARPVEALEGAPIARALAFVGRRRTLLARAGLVAALLAAGTVAVVYVRAERARARREEDAAAALAALVEAAGHVGAGAPSVTEAFDAFVRSPGAAGTVALSEAWRWRGASTEGPARTAALVSAYVTAPDAAAVERAAIDLADALAVEQRWTALLPLVARLPPDVRPDLHAAAALARLDLDAAAAGLGEDAAPALTPLRSVRPVDVVPDHVGVVLADGVLVGLDHRLERRDLAGRVRGAVDLPGEVAQILPDGDVAWIRTYMPDTIARVALADLAVTPVVATTAGLGKMAVADTDGDGVREVYVSLPYPERRLATVRDGALVPVDPEVDATGLDLQGIAGFDLDGDGTDELALSGDGWRAQELRVLAGAPPRTATRLRLDGGPLAVGRGPSGAAWIAVACDPPGNHGTTHWLTRLRDDGALAVMDTRAIAPGAASVWVVDLDGDGLDDVVTSYWHLQRSAGFFRQLADGTLAREVRLPGYSVVDARDGELWITDGTRGWLAGVPGGAPIPGLAASPPSAPAASRWPRVEDLVAVGLVAEAGAALGELGRGTPGEEGRAALLRALALLAPVDAARAGDVARALADRGGLAPDEADRVAAALGEVHDFDALRRLAGRPPGDDIAAALAAHDTRLAFDRPIDPRLQVLRPEAVRRRPLGGTLSVRATADRGDLLALPLAGDGPAVEITVDLDAVELDWAAGFELALSSGAAEQFVRVTRGGGGPREAHVLRVTCGADAEAARFSVADGPKRLSLVLTRVGGPAPTFGCRVAGHDAVVTPLPALPAGPTRLVLRAHLHKGFVDALTSAEVREIRVRGAAIVDEPADGDARAFADGDVAAIARARDGRDPLLAALAAGAAGDAGEAPLAALPERDRRFLVRTDPERWAGPLRTVTGHAFAALARAAWDIPLEYGEGDALLRLPALADLPLTDEAGRGLGLSRARWLLGSSTGFVEAERILAELRASPAPSEAWLLTARLRLRAGDRAAAAGALRRAVETSANPGAVGDAIHDDAEFAPLAPAEVPATPRFAPRAHP